MYDTIQTLALLYIALLLTRFAFTYDDISSKFRDMFISILKEVKKKR